MNQKVLSISESSIPFRESANDDNVSNLKTQLGCPSKLTEALKKQTNMSESQIHVRYLMFKSQYPSGKNKAD